ncbi:hypothetical protein H0A66_00475 [Alcaligenaceae bacterium]|nr:hypothetical protein [Alcaligenaceae bacterium]
MNRRQFLLAASAATLTGLAGCLNDSGKKFVGYWKEDLSGDKKFPALMQIQPNDSTYLITVRLRDRVFAKYKTFTKPGNVQDNIMMVDGKSMIAYTKATDTVQVGNERYTRITESEYKQTTSTD